MKTTYIKDVIGMVDREVTLYGWVHTKRDHKGIVFIDLRDVSGVVQIVGGSDLSSLNPEDVVKISGTVQSRPSHMVNPRLPTGEIEIKVSKVTLLSASQPLPFEIARETLDLTLPTLLDWRPLTLRHPKQQAIFKVQESLISAFRNIAKEMGCTEVFVPTIVAGATEGGAEVFKLKYFDHDAYLVQSPQLYKQMMVPVFERVMMISHAYRAEPSVTTRHLTESIQMDCEFGFVDFEELLDLFEKLAIAMVSTVLKENKSLFEKFAIKPPLLGNIPRLKLKEAQEIVANRLGREISSDSDLSPDEEREIGTWAKEEKGCDFVTITHFPLSKRAFYTAPDPEDKNLSLSYDLLFCGAEIMSGSLRISDYDELAAAMKARGLDSSQFALYLQSFRFGIPPHGGFSFGLERFTMLLFGLANIREASLFPRDMERIDINLNKIENGKKETTNT